MLLPTLILLVGGGVTVTLPSEVSVKGTELLVGSVAEVTGEDAAQVERVKALSLGYAPAPGYGRVLQREVVAQRLRAELLGFDLRVVGEDLCRVAPETEVVSAAALEQAARAALEQRAGGSDLRATLKLPLQDLVVPAARGTQELRARFDEAVLASGTEQVPVEVRIDGLPYRTVWTTWELELWAERPVLVRSVAAGDVLKPSDFTLSRVRMTQTDRRKLLRPTAYGHSVALRDLAAGSVVAESDVQRVKVVRKEDQVSLEVVKGPVRARSLVIAQQDGRVGDSIRVVLRSNGKEVVATVVSADLVRIVLD